MMSAEYHVDTIEEIAADREREHIGSARSGIPEAAWPMIWLAVGVGGALGSMARHGVNHLVHKHWLVSRFPLGTVLVNVAGCFLIGLLAGLTASERIGLRLHWREFLFVGLLGGFTTFSTFGLDTFLLGRTHSVGAATLNVGVQVIGGLIALWLGYRLGL
jgi:CrcB protein